MKQTTTRVFGLPVRPYPLSESFISRNKGAYKWVPMKEFPAQHRRCCQRNRQGLPQMGVSSVKYDLMRKPLFVFILLGVFIAGFITSQTSYAAADKDNKQIINNKPLTLPALPCTNTLNTLPDMQLIPAGVFNMGSPDSEKGKSDRESPLHPVAIYRPFALSRCEITVGQFKRFISETDYQTDAERGGGCFTLNKKSDSFEQQASANWKSPGFSQTDDHPVVCLSWQDAKAYTRWLSVVTQSTYRLPTEAEWEYAARTLNGSGLSRYWGDDPDKGCAYANGADQALKRALPDFGFSIAPCNDSAVYTQTAGAYRRNAFGLSDMLGNAWEYVEDCYHDNYVGAPLEGSAWQGASCDRRVVRGGGWFNDPQIIRSANRDWSNPDGADNDAGFRIARAL